MQWHSNKVFFWNVYSSENPGEKKTLFPQKNIKQHNLDNKKNVLNIFISVSAYLSKLVLSVFH